MNMHTVLGAVAAPRQRSREVEDARRQRKGRRKPDAEEGKLRRDRRPSPHQEHAPRGHACNGRNRKCWRQEFAA